MPKMLHILIVEDQPADVDLMLHELRKAGYEPKVTSVETESEYLSALGKQPELILADYTLPQFNGLRALELLQERNLEIPFIIISGTINEEVAVQAMKNGAADYVLKDRMARLGQAVDHALAAHALRIKNQGVEQALRESEAKFRLLVQGSFDGIVVTDDSGMIIEWNESMEKITGIARKEALGKAIWDMQLQAQPPEHRTKERRSAIREAYLHAIERQSAPWFYQADIREIQHVDGSRRFIERVTFPVKAESHFMLGSVMRDVSGRMQAEAEIRQRAEQAEALVSVAGKLTARLDLETVLKAVCEETARALQVQASMVLLYDQSKDQLTQRAFFSSTRGQVIEIPPLSRAAFERYAPASKAISILPDLKLRSEPELAELSEKLGARTAIYLRMNHDRRFIGLLAIYACGQRREFRKDELSLLTGFASQAAAVIYNAWLFEQVRKGRESLVVLSRMLLEVQEEERRSLARELHDQIGQTLTGLKMLFDSLDGIPAQAAERLEVGRSLVVDLIERTRRISLDLRPSMLDDLGLLPALLWHNERCREQAELEIDFKHAGLERRFPTEIETAAYRIIQEGCTNIIRHAGVRQAKIRVWSEADVLHIRVEDRGAGFEVEPIIAGGSGNGLSGMRERALLIGGNLEIYSKPSQGTILIAHLPFNNHIERREDDR
jgi:PAS domain S-box-containing protein